MPSGRVRQFDADEALDRALEVFWARGYEGATLPELTKAMGINRPSLYAAFGNKEQLFHKALDRYQTGPMSFLTEALRSRPPGRWSRQFSRASSGCSATATKLADAWLCPGPSRAARRRRRCAGSWPG